MKGLFKSKPRSPPELVRHVRDLILLLGSNSPPRSSRRNEKLTELAKNLRELKDILYGEESGPVAEACCKVTQEFFNENTFRLLIHFLPELNLEARKDATEIVMNLQRQRVNCKLIASDYLELNKDLMDHLIVGYEDMDLALHFGAMLRECIRHQNVARYVLESQHMINFFDYIRDPNYDVASDAFATFKELLTRHKSTVAEYLRSNYDWFFAEYNSRLLEPQIYITRRQSTKLLGEILLDRSNSSIMMQYVSSKENLKILMILLKDSSTNISLAAFDVFKLFVANTNKPPEIVNLLVANKTKLLRILNDFNPVAGDFETDKTLVVNVIATLQPIIEST